MARAMPVLPDDGSMICWPGRSEPAASASRIICRAMRSLTEPAGFCDSSLARMRSSGLGLSTLTSTSGLSPIRSSTDWWTAMALLPRGCRWSVHVCRSAGGKPTEPVNILGGGDDNRFLGDGPVGDPVATQHGRGVLQGHDDVVPLRVDRLAHVGGR